MSTNVSSKEVDRSTTSMLFRRRTRNRVCLVRLRAPLWRPLMAGIVAAALSVSAQAYNPGPGSTAESLYGHQWITNKAIDYLKVADPMAYVFANRYRQELLHGAWFADRNSATCHVSIPLYGRVAEWPCDSTNHYEPRFRWTWNGLGGAEGSVAASEYAQDLFSVALDCWQFRDSRADSLPGSCRVKQWRAVHPIRITDFDRFSRDGDPIALSPLTVMGWALHLLQDVTVPHHTHREPGNWTLELRRKRGRGHTFGRRRRGICAICR